MEKCQLRQLSSNFLQSNLIAPLQASLQNYKRKKIAMIVQIMFQLKQLHRSNKLYILIQLNYLKKLNIILRQSKIYFLFDNY